MEGAEGLDVDRVKPLLLVSHLLLEDHYFCSADSY